MHFRFAFFIILSSFFLLSCSKSTSSSGAASTSTASNATTILTNSPDVNPSSLDSASGVTVSQFTSDYESEKEYDSEKDEESIAELLPATLLDLEIVSAPVTNGMQFTLKQCANSSQSHFAQITATSSGDQTKYVKTETLSSAVVGHLNVTSTVYTNASGFPVGSRETTIRADSPYNFYSSFLSTGALNKLAITDGTNHVVAAWTSNLGCAKVGVGGTQVAFALAVSGTGQRTCTASGDTTQCANLPTMITSVPAYATFSGAQTYSCAKAAGCTLATPSHAAGLEDAGGNYCASLSGKMGYWNTATSTPDCTTVTTAAGVCNCLWPMYAAAAQKTKASARSGECKVKGMAVNGNFDLGTDLTKTQTVCVESLGI